MHKCSVVASQAAPGGEEEGGEEEGGEEEGGEEGREGGRGDEACVMSRGGGGGNVSVGSSFQGTMEIIVSYISLQESS